MDDGDAAIAKGQHPPIRELGREAVASYATSAGHRDLSLRQLVPCSLQDRRGASRMSWGFAMEKRRPGTAGERYARIVRSRIRYAGRVLGAML